MLFQHSGTHVKILSLMWNQVTICPLSAPFAGVFHFCFFFLGNGNIHLEMLKIHRKM